MVNKETFKDSVITGKYNFLVTSDATYCSKEALANHKGKMEDMPGSFLTQKVTLQDISGQRSWQEQGAVEHQLILNEIYCEITREPRGYAELRHKQLVELVTESPENYTRNIPRQLKKL